MSVKASDRKPSKMQFEELSNEVRDDVSRVLTNKRLVEPKWKYIIAVPGVQMAELICWYIKAANFIWPKDYRPGKHPRRLSWMEGELRKEECQTYCADDGRPVQQIIRNTENHKTNQWR